MQHRPEEEDRIIVHIDVDLEDLIPDFLDNRRVDLIELERYFLEGRFDRITSLAHSMKGSGGGYGFEKITEIGSRLEKASKNSDAVAVHREIKVLSNYLDNLEVVYVE